VTTPKYLSIVGVATLPLAALTALAFFSTGERGGTLGNVPEVPISIAEAGEKATAALQGKAAAETAFDSDPAGFRSKADGAAGNDLPYLTAVILAEAHAAAKEADIDRTSRALASLADESTMPIGVRADVAKHRQRLERHATWLKSRSIASDALRVADETMRAPASIANANKTIDTVDELRRRLPQVAKADALADEPGDALTGDEAAEATRLRQWAVYRASFLALKAKHTTLEKSKPDSLKALVDGFDQFLATHDRPGAPDPDACVGEARRLRSDVQLALLWAKAAVQDTPATLAPAVLAWLDEPRLNAGGDADRRVQAAALMKAWLERHLPSPPKPPAGLQGMQEAIIDDGQTGKRLVAIFQAVPGQPRRYRWWYTAAERKELPLGKDSGFLVDQPTPPKCIAWATRYRENHNAYLAGFMADDGHFATECRNLADACRAHMQVPAFDPEADVAAPALGWEKLFADAAERASAFDRACRESGLLDRIRTRTP